MTWITDNLGVEPATQIKVFTSIAVVVVLLLLRFMVLRAVHRRFEEPDIDYRARKTSSYVVVVLGLLTLSFVWLDAFDDLPTYLGLVSAGIAIGLADLLKNMAGWMYILSRRPFRVGDRIEVDGTRGDVVDVRLFRFSLMEVGNWVDAEQSTGRLVHVPNGIVFTTKIANYTEGFDFIWHEVPVLVTFESDWKRAEELINRALRDYAPDVGAKAGHRIRATARRYQIKVGKLTPIVYLTVRDSGVLLTGRYLVNPRQRRSIEERIWRSLLESFAQEESVDLAYPTVRAFFEGPIRIEGDS